MDYIITTEQLTKKYKKFHLGQQCFASYSQGQHLWFSRSQRCGEIYDHENVAGPDRADKGQLYY